MNRLNSNNLESFFEIVKSVVILILIGYGMYFLFVFGLLILASLFVGI